MEKRGRGELGGYGGGQVWTEAGGEEWKGGGELGGESSGQ